MDAYHLDYPFTERPLVWKAQWLLDQGKTDEALSLIQKASNAKAFGNQQGASERRKTAEVCAAIHRARGEMAEAAQQERLVEASHLLVKAADWEVIGGLSQANPYQRVSSFNYLGKIHRLSKRWDLAYELEKSLPLTEKPSAMYPMKAVYSSKGMSVPDTHDKNATGPDAEPKVHVHLHEVNWLKNLIQLMKCRESIKIDKLRSKAEKTLPSSPLYRS